MPGHAGIQQNKRADRAAKKALNCNVETCLIPCSDLKPLIATHIKNKCQHEWDENINNLHEIEPSQPPQIHAGGRPLLYWPLTAYICFPAVCIGCQSPLTLKHILLDCFDFLAHHQQFYSAGNMHDLFPKVKQDFGLFENSWSLPPHIVQIHQLIILGSI